MALKMTLFRALLAVPLFCVLVAPQSKGQSTAAVPSSITSAPSAPSQATSFGPITVPEISPGILEGYLERGALPDSVALVPQVPTPGTAAYALDEAVSRTNLTLHGSQRWDLATMDADLTFPQVTGTFSCAVGVPLTEAEMPHLYMLLRRSFTDAALSTYAAKNRYKRARPFVENKQSTCTPRQEDSLMKDGSYPSGHTAIGWAWALILTEIVPSRTDSILARGRAFGDSRLVCNVHWQSDVNEGRVMGASTVARLHADAGFRADLDAAKTEYAVAVAKGLKPSRDCAAEAAALAISPVIETKPVVH
jgi:acid phosphatase (class A)